MLSTAGGSKFRDDGGDVGMAVGVEAPDLGESVGLRGSADAAVVSYMLLRRGFGGRVVEGCCACQRSLSVA